MKVALWTPRPGSGGMGALLPRLESRMRIELCTGPGAAPESDLDLFHVADEPEFAYVLAALRGRPGVVLLAEWNLHTVARAEAISRGGMAGYLREARRAHGEAGVFAARQVVQGRDSAVLRALFPLNDRVLEASLGLVAFTRYVAVRAARQLPGRPLAHVPVGLAAPRGGVPDGEGTRATLGVGRDEPLVAVVRPRGANGDGERIARTLDRWPRKDVVAVRFTDTTSPGLEPLVAAADVVIALEHPPRGGLDPAVVTALGAGRPVLVTAGGAAAAEFAEGVVVPVSPGRTEEQEVRALLDRLLDDAALRSRIGRLAGEELARRGDPDRLAAAIVDVVTAVAKGRDAAFAAWAADRREEGTLAAQAMDEVRWAARDLGLVGLPLGLDPLLGGLFASERSAS